MNAIRSFGFFTLLLFCSFSSVASSPVTSAPPSSTESPADPARSAKAIFEDLRNEIESLRRASQTLNAEVMRLQTGLEVSERASTGLRESLASSTELSQDLSTLSLSLSDSYRRARDEIELYKLVAVGGVVLGFAGGVVAIWAALTR